MRPENRENRTTEGKTSSPPYPYPSANDSSPPDRMRILVVDDNPTNRKLLRVLLEAEGHTALEADNGVAALQVLEQCQIDAVISDILMPEMDGYRLSYEIRKSPKFRDVPFIVYTASYTLPSDEKLALQFGVDKFIRKPASGEEILKNLYEAVAAINGRERKDLEKPEEAEVMREYSQVLVRKLEQTIVELSEANRNLAERTALAEFVAAVSTAISEARGLREMLQRCCDAMVSRLEAAFARIWTLNEKENVLELQASAGMYTHIDGGHARIPVGQFKIGLIASERAPHLTNSVIGDPRVNDQTWASREGMVAFAGYPLMIGDQLVGVMALFARRTLSQNILDVMGTVAQNIAVGIQRQRAEERVNQNLNRIRALHEIDLAITSSLDLPTVLDVLLKKMELFFPYPTVSTVRLLNRTTGELEALACHNIDRDEWRKSFSVAPGKRARRVLDTKRPQFVRNVAIDPESVSSSLYLNNGLVSHVGVPLIARDEPLGVLNLYTREEHEFSAEEIEFLMTLAGQAAIAIHNAQLHEQTQRHLRRIEGVSEINNAITSTLSLQNVLDVLLEKTELFCPIAVACGVRLFDEVTGNMVPLACRHIPFEEWRQEVGSAQGRLTGLLIETRRPVAILNMHIDSRTSLNNFARRHGLVSYLGVPLIVRDKFIGNLVMYTKDEHAFSAEEIEFFTNLASQAAIAIHNARLYEETERRRREAEELARLARSLTETLDMTVVGERIVTSVRELFGVQGSTLRLREANGSFRRLASSGEVFSQTSAGDAVPSGVGLTSRAIAEGKPIWSRDTLNDPEVVLTDEMRDYQIRSGNRSMIAVPLHAHEKLIGALTLSDRTGRIYSDSEVALLQTFADQAALALENAGLYEQTERQLRRIEALREIDKAITSTLDLGTVLNVLMEKLEIFFTYPSAATVRLFDKDTGLLEPVASRNIEIGEWITALRGVQRNEKSYGRLVIEQAAPLVIANLQTDPRTQHPDFYRERGLISCAGVPLIAKDEVLGVLSIYTKEEHSFSNQEIELLMILAGQAAIAIHNARLYEETNRSKRELETTNQYLERSLNKLAGLYTAMTPVALSESLTEMLSGIIDRLIEATGTDAALIRMWDRNAGDYPVIAQRGYSQEFVKIARPDHFEGAIDRVIKHGEPIITPNIVSDDRLRRKAQERLGFRSCAILPLRVHGEVRGVIEISSRTEGYFDDQQTDHLSAVARQMGIALENRELFYNLQTSRNELERANAALKESNQMLSALHEVAAAASQSLESDRVLQAAIERITDIFGFQATLIHIYNEQTDEMLRRAAFEKDTDFFSSAGSFKKGQGVVGTVAESGKALIFEDVETDPGYWQLSRSKISGEFGYYFFAVFPIKSKLRILGTLAVANIAPRKLRPAEVQLLESLADQIAVAIENSDLYDKVLQKVQELEQKTGELERSNQVKDEFLSVMSHELRTPLNVIMGYTGLLKGAMLGEINPKQMDATSTIMGQCMELLELVNEILRATQIGSGKTRAWRADCSLGDLLDGLKSSYAIPQSKELTISWNYPAMLPTVKTDEDKLKHILQNLINNAVKFTDKGQVVISARVIEDGMQGAENRGQGAESGEQLPAVSDPQGGKRWLEFQVADTGVGIPKDQLAAIFDRFRQVDSSETRPYGGIGLGLYIVKNYIELMGGRVKVESEPGKGSTFTVVIPCEVEIGSFQATEATLH